MNIKILLFVGLSPLLLESVSYADATGPSFDCSKASSLVERTICVTPDLSMKDRVTAQLYRLALTRHPENKAALANGQKSFLNKRDACTGEGGKLVGCIDDAYLDRGDQLNGPSGGNPNFATFHRGEEDDGPTSAPASPGAETSSGPRGSPAADPLVTHFSSGGWQSTDFHDPANPGCSIGGDSMVPGNRLMMGANRMHPDPIDLVIRKPGWTIPNGTSIKVQVVFSDGAAILFIGRGAGQKVEVLIQADEVRAWVHEFTTSNSMQLSFSGGEPPWTFDLTGATAVVNAMADCFRSHQISGLAPPFDALVGSAAPSPSSERTSNQSGGTNLPYQSQQPTEPMPSTPVAGEGRDRGDDERRLAISRAEADRAKAEAEKAKFEAEKAQAEADRARSEADVLNSKKQFEAEARKKADEQMRAEHDAHGIQP